MSVRKHLQLLIVIGCFTASFSCAMAETSTNNPLPITIKQQLLTGQFKLAAKELRKLSNDGHAEAQYQLAILFLNGKGVSKSVAEAETLLTSSAESFADSAFLLGSLYQKGKQLQQNSARALKYLKISATAGNKKATRLIHKLEENEQNRAIIVPELQNSFTEAIKNADLIKVRKIFNKGADLNQPDELGYPPLVIAIKNQQADIVQWLLQQQSLQLSQRDRKGNTALHQAAESNQLKVLIALASKSKDLEPLNNDKQTPLILAAIKGHKQTAQWLLSKKSDPDRKDIFAKSARNYARKANLSLVFETKDNNSRKQQQRITQKQRQHQLKALTTESNSETSLHYQWPILHIAVAQKQTELSELILQKGNDPWQINPIGETALALALLTEQPELLEKMLQIHLINSSRDEKSINSLFSLAIHKNNAVLVEQLLLFISNANRNYALTEAVKANSPKVVEYLLKQTGIKPTGDILHMAINSNYIEVVAKLLLQEAPVNWKDSKGRHALWVAADNSNHNLVSLFILYKAKIDETDNKGQSALMRATIKGCIACVEELLRNNADPEKTSNTGNSAVMFAAQYSDQILKLFTAKDIDISERNNQTLTPLMLAIKRENLLCIKTLLEAGANPKRRNELGQNAFDMAAAYPKILTLLEQY